MMSRKTMLRLRFPDQTVREQEFETFWYGNVRNLLAYDLCFCKPEIKKLTFSFAPDWCCHDNSPRKAAYVGGADLLGQFDKRYKRNAMRIENETWHIGSLNGGQVPLVCPREWPEWMIRYWQHEVHRGAKCQCVPHLTEEQLRSTQDYYAVPLKVALVAYFSGINIERFLIPAQPWPTENIGWAYAALMPAMWIFVDR